MTPPPDWREIATFCLFVGYARSGHSAIGSLIDAHPQAAVSHELNAVKRFFEGVERDALFAHIVALAQAQARSGRQSSRADGGVYRHVLDGQAKTDARGLTLLGDKKGAGTAWQFARRGVAHLGNFTSYIGVPVKMLHVIRNPFDIVAAGITRGGSNLRSLVPIVAGIRQQCLGEHWLDVYYEDVIAQPRQEITRILEFLGLPVIPDHLDACGAYLYQRPHRRRFEVPWPSEARAMVEGLIAGHDYLGRYSWDG